MRWSSDQARKGGGRWRCAVKQRNHDNAYVHSRKGRERQLRRDNKRRTARITYIEKELSHS